MFKVRKSSERGFADHGWLKARHTFSFADYFDRNHMHYRSLRVINEDRVAASGGFPTHPHKDMEIVTYMLGGSLEHKDSMGNGSVIKKGEIQYMSAGSGVRHSEFNPSGTHEAHLLQIWIMPNELGAIPRYGQKTISPAEFTNSLKLLVSPSGEAHSISIRQDAKIFASLLQEGHTLQYSVKGDRGLWIQLAKGNLLVRGKESVELEAGDGLIVESEPIEIKAQNGEAEFLLFDLA